MALKDKISVIVPVYNVEKYLNKCVESIVNQTYTNLEIILVDDGSPDNCPQMCDEWAKKDNRIKVIHKKNGGLSSARNAGLGMVSGAYVTFVDSDDWIDNDALEKMLRSAHKNKADIVSAGFYFETLECTHNQILTEQSYMDNDIVINLLMDNIRPEVCGKLYRFRLICDLRFDENIKYAEDLPFNFNIMLNAQRFYGMNACCYHYLQSSENSITSSYITDARATSWKMFDTIFDKCKGDSKLEDASIYRFTTYTFAVLSRVMAVESYSEKYFNEITSALLSNKVAIQNNEFMPKKYKIAINLLAFNKMLFKMLVNLLPFAGDLIMHLKNAIAYVAFFMQALLYTLKANFAKIKNNKNFLFLLLTPCHENYGDQAIALAENKILKDKYVFEITGDMLKRFLNYPLLFKIMLGKSTLVFQGGGYLGTFWFDYGENLLREVMKLAGKNKIVVMPQSIYYENSEYGNKQLEKSKRIYSQCCDLTLTARDKISYEIMKKYYPDIEVYLVPDVVLYLNKCQNESRNGVMLIFRNDIEKGISYLLQDQIEKFAFKNYGEVIKVDMLANHRFNPENRERELEVQFERFRKSELVFTDRLHGMIFAAITGTPCVVLPNKSHKIKGVYDWLFKTCEYIIFSEDLEEIKVFCGAVKGRTFVYDNSGFMKYYDLLLKLIG